MGIEEVRRIDWVETYTNDKSGITTHYIQQIFRQFECSIEATLTMLKVNDGARRSCVSDADEFLNIRERFIGHSIIKKKTSNQRSDYFTWSHRTIS